MYLNESQTKPEVKKYILICKIEAAYWERGEIGFKQENNL